ncbi:Putative Bro-N domain-containing protein 019R [Eumeta japonica]|uniref:Bro-N domain-containing protein 019R n=1 Tax=Eumeta variegata TaxID=151549 RepID=A0A4C1ZWT0_EUMVA|nr:Putative Bro-N domain-containing protein 019R [Eumeta japonica]
MYKINKSKSANKIEASEEKKSLSYIEHLQTLENIRIELLETTIIKYWEPSEVKQRLRVSGEPDNTELENSATKLEMATDGYIYVATSDFYRENSLFKIGSTLNLDERLRRLNSGRTVDDRLYYCRHWEVSDVRDIERTIHDALKAFRHSTNREFFKLPYSCMMQTIESIIY